MNNRHKCPSPGCLADVPNDSLACSYHWRLLPRKIQQQVKNEATRRAGQITAIRYWRKQQTTQEPLTP